MIFGCSIPSRQEEEKWFQIGKIETISYFLKIRKYIESSFETMLEPESKQKETYLALPV